MRVFGIVENLLQRNRLIDIGGGDDDRADRNRICREQAFAGARV